MRVKIRYYTVICAAAGFCREEHINLNESHDLYTLLQIISSKYGGQMEKAVASLLNGENKILWIFVNGYRIKPDQFNVILQEGDVVVLTTPLLVGG